MKIQAWPFLVGRNKVLSYRTVVSPQFLSEHALSNVLEYAVDNDNNPPGNATLREIQGTSIGNICVIFRTYRPNAQDVGLEGTDLLTDGSGRLIPLAEGLAVHDVDQTEDIILTEEDLQIAHDFVIQAYRMFWGEDKYFPEQVSQPFNLHTPTNASDRIILNVVPPLVIPSFPKPKPPEPPLRWLRSLMNPWKTHRPNAPIHPEN